MKKHYRHENDCLNCGADLQGKYCHKCGQENLQIKESFGHMITHAVSDYFHFDHQFFSTLKPLLFQPGKLTNEYMAGKRTSYLHPVKMYIFISLVYFVLLFSSKDKEVVDFGSGKGGTKTEQRARKKELEKLARSIKENSALTDVQKQQALKNINGLTITKRKDGTIDSTYTIKDVFLTTSKDTSYAQYLAAQQKLPESERDGFLQRYYNKKAIAWNKRGGTDSKEMIKESVKHNTPKLMFFLLPMFALMLKITFYKNRKFYVEHLIFTIHLHCFLFLFLTMTMLMQKPFPESWVVSSYMSIFAFFVICLYLYKALRAVYHRSRFRTFTKMCGLMFSYLMALSFGLFGLVLLAAILTV